jgi:hypothetical protein
MTIIRRRKQGQDQTQRNPYSPIISEEGGFQLKTGPFFLPDMHKSLGFTSDSAFTPLV